MRKREDDCSRLAATLWSNLSVETTHLSRGSYSTGQSHVRKPVVRGLPRPSVDHMAPGSMATDTDSPTDHPSQPCNNDYENGGHEGNHRAPLELPSKGVIQR